MLPIKRGKKSKEAPSLGSIDIKKEIIINSTASETRTALLEDEKLVELYVEHPENERMVGDIYKGKIKNILPGMMAVFVDIGMDQNAFLHFSDIGSSAVQLQPLVEVEMDEEISNHNDDPTAMLHEGQDIIVQVVKEPIGNKGARITTGISLPGRFVVLVPNDNRIGVSRKIDNFKEKRRLKQIAQEIKHKGFGIIIRTVAEGKSEEEIKKDLQNLIKSWQKIVHKVEKAPAPVLLHKDLGMASSVIRDLFTYDIVRVVVDSRRLYKKIQNYLRTSSPKLLERVEYYKSNVPVFDYCQIESEIQKSFERKVWLKGGGYIVIDHTEALVSVDVNSGKYIGRKDHEQNSLKVNLQAAEEIARQLRLRDIGGLIVIDFIDMEDEKNQKKVFDELRKELRKDRAKTLVLELSAFGLIEMTRQRVRPSLFHTMSDPCPHCYGTGRVMSKDTVITKIEQWIKRFRAGCRERRLILSVHPDIADYLTNGHGNILLRFMLRYLIKIDLKEEQMFKLDEFRFFSKKRQTDITKEFLS